MLTARSRESPKLKADATSGRPQSKLEPPARVQAKPLWDQLATRVQRKLTVGAPNDPLEHEADRVADQVMRMPDPAARVAAGEHLPGTARPAETPAPAWPVAGRPLPPPERGYFEQRLGNAPELSEPTRQFSLERTAVVSQEGFGAAPAPRRAANLAVQQQFRAGVIQAKLAISQPGDPDEQEADRVADQVMSSAPVGTIHRKCEACAGGGTTCPKCEEDKKLQRRENPGHASQTTPAINSQIAALRGGGQPLPPSLRAFFEPRFGTDFSQVRVRTDYQTAEAARSIQARAFTIGRDIAFGAGHFAPETLEGKRLLAHELTHVVQQGHRAPLAGKALDATPGDLVMVRRDEETKPTTLDEALRTGDSSQLNPFRPFTGITDSQLLSLVNLIVTQALVSWREESILEEAWRSHGNTSSLTAADYALWKSCEKRGADIKNVFWLRELRSQFGTEVRELARHNLEKNSETIDTEAKRLGVTAGSSAPGAPASPEADTAIKEQQEQAASIKKAKDALSKLGSIDVGYLEPPRTQGSDKSQFGGAAPPGGLTDPQSRSRAPFNPENPPAYPSELGDGMPAYATIAHVHRKLTEFVAETLNRNPALYALVVLDANKPLSRGGSDALATPGQSLAEARAKIGEGLKGVLENIAKTSDRDR